MRITMESESKEARDLLYTQALEKERKGCLREALLLYEKSLKNDPGFFEGWLNSGALFSRLKESQKAIQCFQKALKIQSDSRAVYNLALELYKSGHYNTALKTLQEHDEVDSLSMKLLNAYCYGKMGQYSRSEKILLTILSHDGLHKAACSALVLLYGKIGDRVSCRNYLEKLREIDPKNPLLDREEIIFQREESSETSQILLFRKKTSHDPELKEITKSLQKPEHKVLLQNIEAKSRKISNKESKSEKDYFDLSLISLMKGEGEEAMDYLLNAVQP